ncbi:protein-glutamine gamma-glutamyltransferase [Bacillus nakamurai]|uniref:protein-glutamine gamma-glutamyltransferase n=1 Tax=Bacillus nakamurai TaxID=1793963 RepID=UPI0020C2204F|nr:protein-glutamine gamma-glutamyltransferase [Bacillus nakamurai]MCP6682396.1 protein-glutamine gamma-glutamyltransferase [Bacillus nakamurai]
MIIISGQTLRPQDIANWQTEESLLPYLNELIASPVQFDYGSIAELMFEVQLRRNIVQAAKELSGSGAKFATFAKTYGNTAFWRVTPEGALELKYRIPASKAIRDIIENGAFYAFECATAIVVIYYLAVLKTVGNERFDSRFKNIILYDWHYEHLPIYTETGHHFLLGDCLYFKNPDFNPQKAQWRGENVIVLGKDQYFAHGLGILTAEQIIQKLNSLRKKNAVQSAYLLSQATRLDAPALYQIMH